MVQYGEGSNLVVGSFCSIAKGLKVFLGGDHRTDWISTYPFGHVFPEIFGDPVKGHPKSRGDVVIGNDVWTGQDVTIMSGVQIADGAVIAAGSHVHKDIGPYEIWGGTQQFLLKCGLMMS